MSQMSLSIRVRNCHFVFVKSVLHYCIFSVIVMSTLSRLREQLQLCLQEVEYGEVETENNGKGGETFGGDRGVIEGHTW